MTAVLEEDSSRGDYSEATARDIDQEVKAILAEAYERAISTLGQYRSELDRVAETLLAREELMGDEVLNLLGLDQAQVSPLSGNGRV